MCKVDNLFDDFINYIENDLGMYVDEYNQNELKEILQIDYPDEFPMICYEYTSDSQFEVDINESKFLNDKIYEDNWLFISNIGIIRIKPVDDIILNIDVFEINENYRNEGFARKIIEGLEHVSKPYYNIIRVTPFDENAKDFWNHLGYYEDKDEKMYKILVGQDN